MIQRKFVSPISDFPEGTSGKTEFMLRRLSEPSASGKRNQRRAIEIAFSGDSVSYTRPCDLALPRHNINEIRHG
jgi:hypothetical protein